MIPKTRVDFSGGICRGFNVGGSAYTSNTVCTRTVWVRKIVPSTRGASENEGAALTLSDTEACLRVTARDASANTTGLPVINSVSKKAQKTTGKV